MEVFYVLCSQSASVVDLPLQGWFIRRLVLRCSSGSEMDGE